MTEESGGMNIDIRFLLDSDGEPVLSRIGMIVRIKELELENEQLKRRIEKLRYFVDEEHKTRLKRARSH